MGLFARFAPCVVFVQWPVQPPVVGHFLQHQFHSVQSLNQVFQCNTVQCHFQLDSFLHLQFSSLGCSIWIDTDFSRKSASDNVDRG